MNNYFCDLESIELSPGHWRHTCRRCGRVDRNRASRCSFRCDKRTAEKPSQPRPPAVPCVLLGPEVDRVLCPSCGGMQVHVKVFACEKHGRCQLGNKIDNIQSCGKNRCPDYKIPLILEKERSLEAPPIQISDSNPS